MTNTESSKGEEIAKSAEESKCVYCDLSQVSKRGLKTVIIEGEPGGPILC